MDQKNLRAFTLQTVKYLNKDHEDNLFLDGMIIGLLPIPTEPSILTTAIGGKPPLLVAPVKAQALPTHIAGLVDHGRAEKQLFKKLEAGVGDDVTFNGFEAQMNFIR